MEKKKILAWVTGILCSLCFVFILLITSIELGAYGSWKFYEKEYEKYNVLEDVNMEMPDVMYVTKEMMAFLKGDRENLIVNTVVNGQEREFFNEKEIAHMEDVQYLFIRGLVFRMFAAALMFGLLIVAIVAKMPWKRILPKAFQYTTIGLGVITAVTAGIIATDFTTYFTKFHEVFFSNDLWLLDPDTDLLINILPEGFFVDMAARIGMFFAISLIISFIITVIIRKTNK